MTIQKSKPAGFHGATLLLFTALIFGPFASSSDAAPRQDSISVIPTITGLSLENGQFVATGVATAIVNGRTTTVPFTAPVDLALNENQTGAGACPILDLALGPINLDLLGLVVETSPICLVLTAYEGGGLLGDLLCGVANLLGGGLDLGQILGGQGLPNLPGLSALQVGQLLGGITNLLNEALGNLLDSIATAITQGAGRVCDILHLELGPLELNLLGLEVILDDCEGGPVVVSITGERGQGNLLGNLLCGLLNSGRGGIGNTLAEILALLAR